MSSNLTNSPPLIPTHFLYLPPGLSLPKNNEISTRDDFSRVNLNLSSNSNNYNDSIRRSSIKNSIEDCNNNLTTITSSRKSSTSSSRSTFSLNSKNSVSQPSSIEFSNNNNNNNSNTNTNSNGRKIVIKDSGEDIALYNARRALWDDCIGGSDSDQAGISSFTDTPTDSEVDLKTDEEDNQDGDDRIDFIPLASPSKPSHKTLSPHSSCLRLPPISNSTTSTTNSNSNSSTSLSPDLSSTSPSSSINSLFTSNSFCSSNTSNSVQFSSEPPESVDTYSPEEYQRGGDPPLEKLSMRDCVELHRLRECVGVWSGKIKKWEEGGTTTNESSSSSNTLPLSPTIGSNSHNPSRRDSHCCPSGVTGVVTLCHSES